MAASAAPLAPALWGIHGILGVRQVCKATCLVCISAEFPHTQALSVHGQVCLSELMCILHVVV